MPSAIDPNVSVTYYKPAERLEFDKETGQYKKRLRHPSEFESRNAPENRPAPTPPLPPPPPEPEAPAEGEAGSDSDDWFSWLNPSAWFGSGSQTEGAHSEELTPDPELAPAPAPAPLPEAGAKDKLNDYLRERALYRRANKE